MAWTELRQSFDFVPFTGTVYIRTYDAGGAPLQRAQIAIGPGDGALAVWNGSDYFVAYGRFYDRLGTTLPSPDVEAVRVTADGHVIEGSRVSLIETRAAGGNISALAWDGAHYFASVSAGGEQKLLLLDREGYLVRSQNGWTRSIAALPSGGFAILRVNGEEIEIVRVSTIGDFGVAEPIGQTSGSEAKIEVHGDRIAVAWHTAAGIVAEELDSEARVIASVMLPDDATIESLVWRESSWVAAYDRASAGCIVRFGSGAEPTTQCSDTARQPFVGIDRAAWVENGREVWSSSDLSFAGGDLSSLAATEQSDAAAVATATGSIVAWFEAGAMHVGGLAADGSRRAERTIESEAEAHHPAMATAGAQTLLVYVDGVPFRPGAIRVLRLDAQGQPLAAAFTIGHGKTPSVASDGRDWLVVWQSPDDAGARPQVLAARITPNGDATAEVFIFAGDAVQGSPSVAWSGVGYVVA